MVGKPKTGFLSTWPICVRSGFLRPGKVKAKTIDNMFFAIIVRILLFI